MNSIDPTMTEKDFFQLESSRNDSKITSVVNQWLILINIENQRLHLISPSNERVSSFLVSTAQKGTGQLENTGKTPLGWHKIEERIGEGADPFAIFKSRVLTGEIAKPNQEPLGSITGRILRLKGLEEGFNLGKNAAGEVVDSFDRYIYIHGTNNLKDIGQPVSGGCIRMNPNDVVTLFNQVTTGTHVKIYA